MANNSHAPLKTEPASATAKCPNCQADGNPFEVEEGRGYRRVTYRCAVCHHTWAETTAVARESL
jgi:hypothetical protein